MPERSRLAQLYGLPKTHKPKLAMRPILSATGTYNFMLAKWLDEKLKPISINEFTVSDPLRFSEELRKKEIVDGEILVSAERIGSSRLVEHSREKPTISTGRKAIRADRRCSNGIATRAFNGKYLHVLHRGEAGQ
ncbi:Hypothetical predicted protein, partial [Paramuricea clavata]